MLSFLKTRAGTMTNEGRKGGEMHRAGWEEKAVGAGVAKATLFSCWH